MKPVAQKQLKKIISKAPLLSRYLSEKVGMAEEIQLQRRELDRLQNAGDPVYYRTGDSARVIFLTNQLDESGAPRILSDVVREFMALYPSVPAGLQSYTPAAYYSVEMLRESGIEVVVHDQLNMIPEFVKGDVIVANTAAFSAPVKNAMLTALESDTANKLIWYIHEDWPEVFFSEDEQKRIGALLDKNKASIYIPAAKALANHTALYGGKKGMHKLPFHFELPEHYYRQRQAKDFDKLNYVMVGKTGEGIKGQLPILYAFIMFKEQYYDKNPSLYRDFELRLIALEADYLSLQILRHARSLKGHFKHYPPLSHDDALTVIDDSNMTICYSMRECLPIFVFEGMAMGHPILRNDVSGMEEQLMNGKNGFLLESEDIVQVVSVIEASLNKTKTSNEQLAAMSKLSEKIAKQQKANSYSTLFKDIVTAFKN